MKMIHQRAQLLLVPLSHRSERAFLGAVSDCKVLFFDQVIGKERGHEFLTRMGQETGDVFVERVLVLVQPSIGSVFNLAGVMVEDEALLEPRSLVLVGLSVPELG